VHVQLDHIVIKEIDMLGTQTQRHHNLTVDGVTINVLSLPQAVTSIVSAALHGDNFSVCTLNLDHVVKLQQQSDFRSAYQRASFVTADGFPIVVLARLLGARIRRTTGMDRPVRAGWPVGGSSLRATQNSIRKVRPSNVMRCTLSAKVSSRSERSS